MKPKASRALLVLTACVLLASVLFGRLPDDGKWTVVLANAAHGPVFAIVTIIMLILGLQRDAGRSKLFGRCLFAVGIAVALGVCIEIVQSFIGGDAEFMDVVNDAIGSTAGAALFIVAFERGKTNMSSAPSRRIAWVVSMACIVFMAMPVTTMCAAYWMRDARYPVLFDPDTALSTYFMQAYDGSSAEVKRVPGSSQQGLRVRPGTSFPWGLLFSGVYPDWRDKRFFALQLVNPTDNPLTLQLRIYDGVRGAGRPNGFYMPLSMAPHSTSIQRLPLADLVEATGIQHVDLSAAAGIVFYGDRDNLASEFYVLKMWLE